MPCYVIYSRCLQILIKYGGNVHLIDHTNWSPLHWAAASGKTECCQVLLEHGARRCAVTNVSLADRVLKAPQRYRNVPKFSDR